jgi:phytoene synthase
MRSSPDADDLAACRALLRGGSRSFFAAALLLPARVSEPATALYAFCRVADDAIDCDGGGVAAICRLRERLHRASAGCPADASADRALAAVIARHALPVALLDALLDGFEWDAQGRRYETFDDLGDYAARVAGTVGAMMAVLMGARAPEIVARACDLGIAMQLTNIARDVGEDARAGRLYLPLAWLREAGVDPDEWLAAPVFSDAISGVVRRLLREADGLYARADAGIAKLPMSCRPGIFAARRIYAEIGRELERQGCNSVVRRAVVPTSRKIVVAARSFVEGLLPPAAPLLPVPRESGFLVASVAAAVPPRAVRASPWWAMGDRVVWLLDLFLRLQQSETRGVP